ncbi:MAG TPA: hypothetical protein VFW23_17505, partial [Tepidisphaeraceae bacterium]|nr:hypothetical protein [Tepidisphaeraceae bacterium]
LSDQQAFENGLVEDFKGTKLFSDPVVYPHWTTEAGKQKLVYIVTGQYWDGQSQTRNGKTVAEWTPRCVITQTPYKPRIGIPDAKGQVVAEYPSVVQFLDALHRVYKVNYHYAWWAVYPVLTWIVGCAIVIGGIWPTLVNLLTFGTLTRPPEVKAVSLWNILGTKRRHVPKFAYSAPQGDEEDELLAPSTPAENPETTAPAAQPLATAPLEIVPQDAQEQHSYGADKDDFYPTERHAPPSNGSH